MLRLMLILILPLIFLLGFLSFDLVIAQLMLRLKLMLIVIFLHLGHLKIKLMYRLMPMPKHELEPEYGQEYAAMYNQKAKV